MKKLLMTALVLVCGQNATANTTISCSHITYELVAELVKEDLIGDVWFTWCAPDICTGPEIHEKNVSGRPASRDRINGFEFPIKTGAHGSSTLFVPAPASGGKILLPVFPDSRPCVFK